MSAFTDAEIEFVNSQRLGRIATGGADGMPHVMPVAVFYDPARFAEMPGDAYDAVCTLIHVRPSAPAPPIQRYSRPRGSVR